MDKIFKYEKVEAKYCLYYRFAEVFIQKAHDNGILDIKTYVERMFDYHKLGDLSLSKPILINIVKNQLKK